MIKILLNGAAGRMGHVTAKALEKAPGIHYVGGLNRQDDLTAAIETHRADVVVDFTSADGVFKHVKTIIAAGARPVVGTSGLTQDQINTLTALCHDKQLGGIIAPNFSVAMVLMMQCAARISHYYPHAEIIEMHHDGKQDAPSGTAIKTAEMIVANSPQHTSVQTLPGSRGALHHQVPIHAIRLPGLIARQDILFGGPGETLSLSHNSLDRQCFMPGVILACEKVMTLDGLVYGLEHLL